VALIWWAWFRPSADKADTRQQLICAIFACLVAVLIARGLAIMLPFRNRPMAVAAFHFQRPYGADEGGLINWSSFPSDHATAIFFLSDVHFLCMARCGNCSLILRIFVYKHAPPLPGISLSHGYPGGRLHRNYARIDSARQSFS
jgi:hypothetical protein